MPVFADSNIVVYLIEQPPDWGPRATGIVDAVLASGDRIVISELVRMECRIRPLATGDTATLAAFERFLRPVGSTWSASTGPCAIGQP